MNGLLVIALCASVSFPSWRAYTGAVTTHAISVAITRTLSLITPGAEETRVANAEAVVAVSIVRTVVDAQPVAAISASKSGIANTGLSMEALSIRRTLIRANLGCTRWARISRITPTKSRHTFASSVAGIRAH